MKNNQLGTEEEQLGFNLSDADLIECEAKPDDAFEMKVLKLTTDSSRKKGIKVSSKKVDSKNQIRISM